MPKWTTETHTIQVTCDVDDGMAEKINAYEVDGWRVKTVDVHRGVSGVSEHCLVVLERDVRIRE